MNSEKWSCVDICVMLHWYYTGGEPYDRPSPAADESTKRLLTWGLIEQARGEKSGLYKPTDKGQTFVSSILSTPLPVQRWVKP